MADVWVLAHHNHDEGDQSVIAVATSPEGAKKAAEDHKDPGWPDPEWVQQANGDWTTYVAAGMSYTAEKFDLIETFLKEN